jgi:hypothetical protein
MSTIMRGAAWVLFGMVGMLGGSAYAVPGQPATPELKYDQPASILIFPFFQQAFNKDTFLTVTNTNIDCRQCGNGFRQGDVLIVVNFINPANCSELNQEFELSPGDTLTLLATQQSLTFSEGWVWLDARDPETRDAIDFDYLIGSALLAESSGQTWEYNAYTFQSFADQCGGDVDQCGRVKTDVNQNGAADFDGCEYAFWPDSLVLDNFFQISGGFDDELVLIAPDHFGDDPTENQHRLNFGFWNNSEARFSRSFDMFCFVHVPLSTISLITTRLGGNNETVDGSGTVFQTGWMEVDATVPLLGVFKQKKNGTRAAAGRELQFIGAKGDDPGEIPASLQRNG